MRRLVVVSATGGIDEPAERAARRDVDEAWRPGWKPRAWRRSSTGGWSGPCSPRLPAAAAGRESRLGDTAAGLASSLRLAGTGTQQPLWSELRRLEMPVLVVAGERDVTYVQHGRRLVDSIGANADLAVIAGAGHACHLEAPARFAELVESFLAGH